MSNEGCSACACGIESACNNLYFPSLALPGLIILVTLLIASTVLIRRKVLKLQIRTFLAIWLIAAVIFAILVWTQTESERDRTIRRARGCATTQPTDNKLSCEY